MALFDPARQCVLITPSDSTDLANGPCRALYVGVLGNVAIATPTSGNAVATITFAGVSGILPVGTTRVYASNTTANNIIALY